MYYHLILLCLLGIANGQKRVKLSPGMTFGNLAFGFKDGGREESLDGYQAVKIDPDFDAEIIPMLKEQGQIVMCYLSVGSVEKFRPYYAEASSREKRLWNSLSQGRLSNFRRERYLDLRKIKKIMPLMKIRMQELKDKGCDVISTDNMDCYQAKECAGQWRRRSRKWKYNRSAKYALSLADMAHDLGMSILIKNSLELYAYPGILEKFDGGSVESCFYYDECDVLAIWGILDKAIFGTEYLNERSCQEEAYPSNVVVKHCPGNDGRFMCRNSVNFWSNCFDRVEGVLPKIEYVTSRSLSRLPKPDTSQFNDRLGEIVILEKRANDTAIHSILVEDRTSVFNRIGLLQT